MNLLLVDCAGEKLQMGGATQYKYLPTVRDQSRYGVIGKIVTTVKEIRQLPLARPRTQQVKEVN